MTAFDFVKFILSGMMVVFGLLITLGGIINMGEDSTTLVADIFLTLGFGMLPLAGGIYLFFRTQKKIRLRRLEAMENRILAIARKHDCRLTVQRLALETELSLDDARRILEQFYNNGYCQIEMNTDNEVIYIFPGLG